jgi:hypothetical protein
MLKFEVSLELGCWDLVLFQTLATPHYSSEGFRERALNV